MRVAAESTRTSTNASTSSKRGVQQQGGGRPLHTYPAHLSPTVPCLDASNSRAIPVPPSLLPSLGCIPSCTCSSNSTYTDPPPQALALVLLPIFKCTVFCVRTLLCYPFTSSQTCTCCCTCPRLATFICLYKVDQQQLRQQLPYASEAEQGGVT